MTIEKMQNENSKNQCASCKCKVPMIVGAIVFSLAMLALGIFLGKTFFSGKQNSNVIPTPIVSAPTAQPTLDPTTNWKTYSSQIYGIKVSYPPDMRFIHNDVFGQGTQETISFENNNGYMSMEIEYGLPDRPNLSTHDTITVLGSPIKRYDDSPAKEKFQSYVFDIPLKNGRGAAVNIQIKSVDDTKTLKLFDQILSTFKFTEK